MVEVIEPFHPWPIFAVKWDDQQDLDQTQVRFTPAETCVFSTMAHFNAAWSRDFLISPHLSAKGHAFKALFIFHESFESCFGWPCQMNVRVSHSARH